MFGHGHPLIARDYGMKLCSDRRFEVKILNALCVLVTLSSPFCGQDAVIQSV